MQPLKGSIPNLPASFSSNGQTVKVDLNGAQTEFRLDSKGAGKSAQGSIVLKRKNAKGAGEQAAFAVKIQNGTWAFAWGINPDVSSSNTPLSLSVALTVGDSTYSTNVTAKSSTKAHVRAKFKK